ncbi:MAG: rhodanese-like domain-containing protein [Candidatus Heimdallarchaeaceae archaeon]
MNPFHWHDVDDLVEKGSFLVDVRRDDEFEIITIKSAIHVSEFEMRQRLDELPEDKPIYAFCQEGFRAYISLMNLLQRNFDVRNLIGGIKTYIMATASQEELKEMAKNPQYRIIF